MGSTELLFAGIIVLGMFLFGWMSLRVKIPDVIPFILFGLALSSLLADNHLLEFAGEVGIVLLFFVLGMEFPISELLKIARRIYKAGILDIILSFGVSAGLALLFQYDWITAILVGGITYATSSSITTKLMQSNKRMDAEESNFILGLLIFEDLAAPVLIAILISVTSGEDVTLGTVGSSLLLVVMFTAAALFISIFVFRRLKRFISGYANEDFFSYFMLGLSLTLAGLALYLNLSEVLGAFLAGIMIAESGKVKKVDGLMIQYRSLFLPFFFFYFGTTITFEDGFPAPALMITLLVWSIAAKILVGWAGGIMYGIDKEAALRAGFSLTQRGEFSIIIAALTTGPIKTFSSIFILISATIGFILFQKAPKISRTIYQHIKKE